MNQSKNTQFKYNLIAGKLSNLKCRLLKNEISSYEFFGYFLLLCLHVRFPSDSFVCGLFSNPEKLFIFSEAYLKNISPPEKKPSPQILPSSQINPSSASNAEIPSIPNPSNPTHKIHSNLPQKELKYKKQNKTEREGEEKRREGKGTEHQRKAITLTEETSPENEFIYQDLSQTQCRLNLDDEESDPEISPFPIATIQKIDQLLDKAKKRTQHSIFRLHNCPQSRCILKIFSSLGLKSLPFYLVNALLNWAVGRIDLKIFFGLPSVLEVVQLQSQGKRCVTVWEDRVDMIHKQPYPPFADQDLFEFAVHDIQHITKFSEAKFFMEQVGFSVFLKKILKKQFFKRFSEDNLFQEDLDHVASDMNASVIHSLGFFKARWAFAILRQSRNDPKITGGILTAQEEEMFNKDIDQLFSDFFNQCKYKENLRKHKLMEFNEAVLIQCVQKMCTPEFSPKEGFMIRQFFHYLGVEKMMRIRKQVFPFLE